MSTSEVFLIALLVIFTAPYLVWRVLRTEYYAPLVVVQIVGGILLGPGVLGRAFPGYYAFVFNPQVIGALNGLAWWAVMLFIWVAGVELDLRQAWSRRGETAVTAGLALGAPLVLGSAVAAGMLGLGSGWGGTRGAPWQVVLGLGMACAVTRDPARAEAPHEEGEAKLRRGTPSGVPRCRLGKFDDGLFVGAV